MKRLSCGLCLWPQGKTLESVGRYSVLYLLSSLKGFSALANKLTKASLCSLKGAGCMGSSRSGYGAFASVSSQNADVCIGLKKQTRTGANGAGRDGFLCA